MTLPRGIGAALEVLLLEGPGVAGLGLDATDADATGVDATHGALCRIALTDRRRVALEWTAAALAAGDDAGANLAVRQSPFMPGVHTVGTPSLAGLPGWLADSLPDSWGRLLTDRQLRVAGIDPATLSGVDRLAIVGRRGPGALAYRPAAAVGEASASADDQSLDLDQLARDAQLVLRGEPAEVLEQLARAGGSAGGSRPKAWIAVDETGRIRSGATELRDGETGWLVKFRAPQHDPEDIGALEFAYAELARRAGLEVAEPRLFETRGGRYFASRRFDRVDGGRRHVLSAAALLDVAHDEAMAADYVDLLKLTRHVTRSEAEVERVYRQAVFNVFAHNRDDHLKQFAFVRKQARWHYAPAYDLTFSDGPAGEHTLLVAGEGRQPGMPHLTDLAKRGGLAERRARDLIDAVRGATTSWREIATQVGVSRASLERVASVLSG